MLVWEDFPYNVPTVKGLRLASETARGMFRSQSAQGLSHRHGVAQGHDRCANGFSVHEALRVGRHQGLTPISIDGS